MLTITGKVLGVTSETVQGPTGSFVSTTIHVLDGYESTKLRTGRDYPPADLPKEGEDFTAEVSVSVFARKAGGAGYQLTALSRVRPGARVASVSNAS